MYWPPEEVKGTQPPDLDLAADYLELKAVLSAEKRSYSQDIFNAMDMLADRDFDSVNAEMEERDPILIDTVGRIQLRKNILKSTYPFKLDEQGDVLYFTAEKLNLAQTAYIISLLLSNLRELSPLLIDYKRNPSEKDKRRLREYFQYIATTAIAAEVGGRAWSFGFPRPDQSGFVEKLTEVWSVIKDGDVNPDPSAPSQAKDDGIDVFACREPKDGLPGYLLIAAQVATGKDWKEKSILADINHRFPKRWFGRQPATKMIAYHVIPFARPDETFRDDVLSVGNLLHRLRVPCRVLEAQDLIEKGVSIEGFNKLEEAPVWIMDYISAQCSGDSSTKLL